MAIPLFLFVLLPGIQIGVFLAGQLSFGFGVGAGEMINYAASIAAFHWMMGNVVLGTKLPWLQRVIPYDRRVRFHIQSTAGIAIAVAYHGLYKVATSHLLDPVTWALTGVILGTFLLAVLWIPVPGFRAFRTRVLAYTKRRAEQNYDRSKRIHKVAVLGLSVLLMLHLLSSELFSQVPRLSAAGYWALYLLTVGAYVLSLTKASRVRATVTGVTEKKGIVTLSLRPDRPVRFAGGQFTFLRMEDSGKRFDEHPFSFLSGGVATDGNSGEITFAMRKIGDFTSGLASLRPGAAVSLRHGFGNFRPRRKKDLCLIGSGIGIVPLLSILKELAEKKDARSIKAVLSVTDREEIPEPENLRRIVSALPRLTLHLLVYSEDGRLLSEEFLGEILPDRERYDYYLCSSPKVRDIVVRSLKNLGIPSSAIRYEAFSF